MILLLLNKKNLPRKLHYRLCSVICFCLQKKFLVFNTYQTYLKNTYNEIVTDVEQAARQDFYWGAKLVRGAYIEQVTLNAIKIVFLLYYNCAFL
jgi:hypothetical protein